MTSAFKLLITDTACDWSDVDGFLETLMDFSFLAGNDTPFGNTVKAFSDIWQNYQREREENGVSKYTTYFSFKKHLLRECSYSLYTTQKLLFEGRERCLEQ